MFTWQQNKLFKPAVKNGLKYISINVVHSYSLIYTELLKSDCMTITSNNIIKQIIPKSPHNH